MAPSRQATATAILAAIAVALTVPRLVALSPSSLAAQSFGTDDAFAAGTSLQMRENQIGGGSLRWTRPVARFRFAGAGPGAVRLEIEARAHRSEVVALANGAIVGTLAPGQSSLSAPITLARADLEVELRTDGFEAGGRQLGTQLGLVRVTPSNPPGFPPRLLIALTLVLAVSLVGRLAAGLSPPGALLPVATVLALSLPAGLWRSDWLPALTATVVAADLAALVVARAARGLAESRALLAAALFIGLVVHGLLPPSPLIAQGDVQMHGNKLGDVARGDLYPTSRTDHRPPFEIPYGVSFYAALSPFSNGDVANVAVARQGAALSSALSLLLLALVASRSSASFATAAVLLWTFAPVNLRTMGYGNLSNVFAQAVFVMFLAAGALLRPSRFRTLLMLALVAISATAHLSSFIVLAALAGVALLLRGERQGDGFRPLAAGVVLAGAYFALFLPLILRQLPRLLGERGGSSGVFDPWRLPTQVVVGLGWPLLLTIILAGLTVAPRLPLPLSRSLGITTAALALAALVSPVEVRYLLAATPLLALIGASVLADDFAAFPRQSLPALVQVPGLRLTSREPVLRVLGTLLLAAAVLHGANVLLEFAPLSGR